MRDAKFTIIEQINQKNMERKEKIILKRENFWIKELKTLKPYGFNQELDIINQTHHSDKRLKSDLHVHF